MDTYRKAYHKPFLKMPEDYIRCPVCGIYRQMDADNIVMPCANCGDGEYQMSAQQITMLQIGDLPLFKKGATMKIYSTAEAAQYLGLSVAAIKYHIYQAKTLKPQRVGNSLVFTQEQLDEFDKARRPQGRPRKEPES